MVWASSYISWIANLLTFGPVLLWSPFAFFPSVFDTGWVDLFLQWNYYSVVITGNAVSGLVLFMWFLAAIATGYTEIWAWWGAQLVLYSGMFTTYYIMIDNWNEFFAYKTYQALVIDAIPDIDVPDVDVSINVSI